MDAKKIVEHIVEESQQQPMIEGVTWQKFIANVKNKTKGIINGLKGEVKDTQQMAKVFAQKFKTMLKVNDPNQDQPSPEEVQQALNQLKEMPQFAALAASLLIPIPGATVGYVFVASVLEKLIPGDTRLLPDKISQQLK